MGLAVSLIIAAIGLILALAVHPTDTSQIDVNTVGWILFLLGLVGLVIDLLLWSPWGPGYLRRTTYVTDSGYPVRRRTARRTVVQDEEVPPAGPPTY